MAYTSIWESLYDTLLQITDPKAVESVEIVIITGISHKEGFPEKMQKIFPSAVISD